MLAAANWCSERQQQQKESWKEKIGECKAFMKVTLGLMG